MREGEKERGKERYRERREEGNKVHIYREGRKGETGHSQGGKIKC